MLRIGDSAPSFQARPVFGRPVEVPADTPRAPLVLVFVPALGSPAARASLFGLQDAFADFDRLGVRVAAVTSSGLAMARDFAPRHHLLFPLIAGDTGALRERYGLGRDRWLLGTLRAGLSRRSWRHGVGRIDASVRLLGADFMVGADGCLVHVRYPRSVLAVSDVDELLRCVHGG